MSDESSTPGTTPEASAELNLSLGESDSPFLENEEPKEGPGYPVLTFNSEKWREQTRAWLAAALILLLCLTVLIIVGATVFAKFAAADAVQLLGVVLSPLVGLVGAATGFYYGGKEK